MKRILEKSHIIYVCVIVTLVTSIGMTAGAKTDEIAPTSKTDAISPSLVKMIDSRHQLESLVNTGQLEQLHSELILTDAMLGNARKEIDKKLVLGGGPTAGYAGGTTEIIGRLEAIRTLVRIALGFSSPYYSFPAGYVPDSVKNSLEAAHDEGELLLKKIDEWKNIEKSRG